MAPPAHVVIRSVSTQVLDPTLMHVSSTQAVPAHVRADLWLDHPACAVELDIRSSHFAQPEVHALGLRALPGAPPLLASMFRAIPVATLVAKALADLRVPVPRPHHEPEAALPATFAEALPGRSRGPIPDTTLHLVADIYRDAFHAGQRPTLAVQRALGCSRSHAGRLVMKTRAAGYLGPTTPAVAAV